MSDREVRRPVPRGGPPLRAAGKVRTAFLVLCAAAALWAGCSSGTVHDESFTGDLTGRDTDSSFVLASDTQRTTFWERVIFREQNDAAREGLFKEVARENPAFVVILGDIVDQGDDNREWRAFDAYAAHGSGPRQDEDSLMITHRDPRPQASATRSA